MPVVSFSSSINQYQPHSGDHTKERSAGHDHYVVFCDECESVHTIDNNKQYISGIWSILVPRFPETQTTTTSLHTSSHSLQQIPGQTAKHSPKRATQKRPNL